MRSTSCSLPISKEKMPTPTLFLMAAWRAISRAREVLPTLGRAASIIKSDFCNPASRESRSLKPVLNPLNLPPCLCNSSILSKASANRLSKGRKAFFKNLRETLKIFFSVSSKISSISLSSSKLALVISAAACCNRRKVAFFWMMLAYWLTLPAVATAFDSLAR